MKLLGACLIGILTSLIGCPILTLDSKGIHIYTINIIILVILEILWSILYEQIKKDNIGKK